MIHQMIKDLQKRINRLRITKSEPVSFSYHKIVGGILENDSEALEELEQYDKVMPESDTIIFIP